MRIVLDTSILVRANERSHGLARELLLKLITSEHVLILSEEMLFELARVLRYPRLQSLFGLSDERVYDFLGFLREVSEIVTLDPLLSAPIRDMNDVIVMQTAMIGDADVICTNDKDFYEPPAAGFLETLGIGVVGDIALMDRLRL